MRDPIKEFFEKFLDQLTSMDERTREAEVNALIQQFNEAQQPTPGFSLQADEPKDADELENELRNFMSGISIAGLSRQEKQNACNAAMEEVFGKEVVYDPKGFLETQIATLIEKNKNLTWFEYALRETITPECDLTQLSRSYLKFDIDSGKAEAFKKMLEGYADYAIFISRIMELTNSNTDNHQEKFKQIASSPEVQKIYALAQTIRPLKREIDEENLATTRADSNETQSSEKKPQLTKLEKDYRYNLAKYIVREDFKSHGEPDKKEVLLFSTSFKYVLYELQVKVIEAHDALRESPNDQAKQGALQKSQETYKTYKEAYLYLEKNNRKELLCLLGIDDAGTLLKSLVENKSETEDKKNNLINSALEKIYKKLPYLERISHISHSVMQYKGMGDLFKSIIDESDKNPPNYPKINEMMKNYAEMEPLTSSLRTVGHAVKNNLLKLKLAVANAANDTEKKAAEAQLTTALKAAIGQQASNVALHIAPMKSDKQSDTNQATRYNLFAQQEASLAETKRLYKEFGIPFTKTQELTLLRFTIMKLEIHAEIEEQKKALSFARFLGKKAAPTLSSDYQKMLKYVDAALKIESAQAPGSAAQSSENATKTTPTTLPELPNPRSDDEPDFNKILCSLKDLVSAPSQQQHAQPSKL